MHWTSSCTTSSRITLCSICVVERPCSQMLHRLQRVALPEQALATAHQRRVWPTTQMLNFWLTDKAQRLSQSKQSMLGLETFIRKMVVMFFFLLHLQDRWEETMSQLCLFSMLIHRLNWCKTRTLLQTQTVQTFKKPKILTSFRQQCRENLKSSKKRSWLRALNSASRCTLMDLWVGWISLYSIPLTQAEAPSSSRLSWIPLWTRAANTTNH